MYFQFHKQINRISSVLNKSNLYEKKSFFLITFLVFIDKIYIKK